MARTTDHTAIGIMDALDYPNELEPIYRAYHLLRHEWLDNKAAFERVVQAYLDIHGEPDV